jgi:hypothetical protein
MLLAMFETISPMSLASPLPAQMGLSYSLLTLLLPLMGLVKKEFSAVVIIASDPKYTEYVVLD